MKNTDDVDTDVLLDAVVVGAGFAGLYAAHRLRESGFTFRAFEKGANVGGSWFWNTYPGARCDVESFGYSFSFSPELDQEWQWTERFATQPEIQEYLSHVADRFELRPYFTFGETVESAEFDEPSSTWTVATSGGERVRARHCIFATGCLSVPLIPDLPGLDSFGGRILMTADWPQEDPDLGGKRVALLGTGSSGVQVLPHLAAASGSVTVFQRTPNYVVPARNKSLDGDQVAELKKRYPEFRERARATGIGRIGGYNMPRNPDGTPLSLEQKFWFLWDLGGPWMLLYALPELMDDPSVNEAAIEFLAARVGATVADQRLAELLKPGAYPFGARRLCVADEYYESFNQDNVSLVSLLEEPLVGVNPKGIETQSGDYEFDVLVLATGFDAVTGALTAIDIIGKDGQILRDVWLEGPKSYLGIMVSGFPNLYTITGPGSPGVLTNVVLAVEQHVEYVLGLMTAMREQGSQTVDCNESAQQAWVDHGASLARSTLYYRAKSWYLGSNVPGKPEVFLPYVGGLPLYQEVCDTVADAGYLGFEFDDARQDLDLREQLETLIVAARNSANDKLRAIAAEDRQSDLVTSRAQR